MSRGIAARTKGDKFFRDNEEFVVEQTFVCSFVDFLGKGQDFEEVELYQFFPKKGKPNHSIGIQLINSDKNLLFVKHVPNIGDGTGYGKWQNKEFIEQTGFSFDSVAAKKETFPFKPANLIGDAVVSLSEVKDVVLSNIIDLQHTGKISSKFYRQVSNAFDSIEESKLPIFKDCVNEHTAIRDYFGEIISPLVFYKNLGISGVTIDEIKHKSIDLPYIKYETITNANLIDSTLIWPNDYQVGLSSKGGTGANASLASLFSVYKSIEQTNEEKYKIITQKYNKEIEFLSEIFTLGIKAGPILAANKLALITANDAKLLLQILGAESSSIIEDYQISNIKDVVGLFDFSRFGNTLLANDCIKYQTEFSPQFYNLIRNRNVRDPDKSKFEYFALSCVAKAVAYELNYNSKLKITEFLAVVLKHTNFVQIHAKTKAIGNDIHFMAFETIYPPVFKGRVLIEADKSFYSTKQPQGGFGFKFLSES